jgi:hypothetical protein
MHTVCIPIHCGLARQTLFSQLLKGTLLSWDQPGSESEIIHASILLDRPRNRKYLNGRFRRGLVRTIDAKPDLSAPARRGLDLRAAQRVVRGVFRKIGTYTFSLMIDLQLHPVPVGKGHVERSSLASTGVECLRRLPTDFRFRRYPSNPDRMRRGINGAASLEAADSAGAFILTWARKLQRGPVRDNLGRRSIGGDSLHDRRIFSNRCLSGVCRTDKCFRIGDPPGTGGVRRVEQLRDVCLLFDLLSGHQSSFCHPAERLDGRGVCRASRLRRPGR